MLALANDGSDLRENRLVFLNTILRSSKVKTWVELTCLINLGVTIESESVHENGIGRSLDFA